MPPGCAGACRAGCARSGRGCRWSGPGGLADLQRGPGGGCGLVAAPPVVVGVLERGWLGKEGVGSGWSGYLWTANATNASVYGMAETTVPQQLTDRVGIRYSEPAHRPNRVV